MNSILASTAIFAGKEMLKKVMGGLCDHLQVKTGRTFKQWMTERQINTLYSRILKVRKVKTIWQIDKAVDLYDFYCDSHVVLNGKRKKIMQLSDFGAKDNILIQGIAGQGKSILLRYLCSNELIRGEYIPLFLELRRITYEATLRDRIQQAFFALGMSVDQDLFGDLASSGKLLILLDAFDEVPDDLKVRVLSDIEDLAATYDNLRIIVTSRPNHGVQASNQFVVVDLDNLHGSEYQKMIYKLSRGQEWAKGLIDHIEKRAAHIKELLCTPLMVTLLVLSYKSYQKLPEKLSDFYDALFQTLLQRHDGTKPGFSRHRACPLDDSEYRQAFEALCIIAKKRRQQSYTVDGIIQVAKEAIIHCAYTTKAQSFVDDIVSITCLIIKDGEEYRFIHKTVQEYYTASYIQKKPDAWAADFYSRIIRGKAYNEWRQELEFLSEIDSYRYNRYYMLPDIMRFLAIRDDDFDREYRPLSNEQLGQVFNPYYVTISEDYRSTRNILSVVSMRSDTRLHDFVLDNTRSIFDAFRKEDVDKIELGRVSFENLDALGVPGIDIPIVKSIFLRERSVIISLKRVIELGGLVSLSQVAQGGCMKLFSMGREIRKTLRDNENIALLDGLI